MYTTMCKVASRKLLYSIGSSAQCSVMTERSEIGVGMGGRFKREGIYVYIQLIHFIVQQKLTNHWKAILHQFFFKDHSKGFRQTPSLGLYLNLQNSRPCS